MNSVAGIIMMSLPVKLDCVKSYIPVIENESMYKNAERPQLRQVNKAHKYLVKSDRDYDIRVSKAYIPKY